MGGVVSERSGGLFKALGKPVKEAIARTTIMKQWMKRNPGSKIGAFRKVLETSGYHGVINEMLEERVGALARATPGIGTGEEFEDPTSKEFWEQLSIEAAAFSLPGMMGAISDTRAKKKAKIEKKEKKAKLAKKRKTEKSKKQKYTKSKFKKKSPKQSRKFNKQSDYRKRAKRKK